MVQVVSFEAYSGIVARCIQFYSYVPLKIELANRMILH